MNTSTTLMIFFLAIPVCGVANATIPNNQEYGVFSQCHSCQILSDTPTALAMIQTAISLYNQKVAAGEVVALANGDMIQLESYSGSTGAYVITDRFYQISHLPVAGWSDVIDVGTEHSSDTYAYVPPPGPDVLGFVANYQLNGGNVGVYWGDLPWINDGPFR